LISVTELRRGVVFELDGEIYRVLEYQHHKPARGNAYIRTRVRNMRSGATLEKTFVSGERVQDIRLDHRTVQYLYNDGTHYHFMDMDTYDQFALPTETLGEAINYLTENMTVQLSFYENEPLDFELPVTVDLKVVNTEPGFRGDTAGATTKPATLSTGLVVQVPLFIEIGDIVRVDTRDGSYVTRVQ